MKTHQLYPVEIFEFRFDPDGVDYIDIITCFDTSSLLKITKIIKSRNLKIKTNIVDFFWT